LVRLSLKYSDGNHIQKFADAIGYNGEIKYNENTCSNGTICKMAYIEICRKEVHDDLTKHGCIQNKSLILRFPFHINEEYHRHILRGYFDGDGSIYLSKDRHGLDKYYNITICSGSHGFIEDCKTILSNNFIFGSISEGSGVKILRIHKNSFDKFYHYLYDDSTISMDRKKLKFTDMIIKNQKWQKWVPCMEPKNHTE